MKNTNTETSMKDTFLKNAGVGAAIGGAIGVGCGLPTATHGALWHIFIDPFMEMASPAFSSLQAPFHFGGMVRKFGLFGAVTGACIGSTKAFLQSDLVTKAIAPSDSAKSDSPKF
jgi:hypothetical protein